MNTKFSDEMIKHGFSYEGSKALFEYYEELRGGHSFDPVAIRCDFTSTKISKK
jgi:hypothetical protein